MGTGTEDLSQDSSEPAKLSLDLRCKEALQKGKDGSISGTKVPYYPALGSVRPESECLFIFTVMENSTSLTPQALWAMPTVPCPTLPTNPLSGFFPWPSLYFVLCFEGAAV